MADKKISQLNPLTQADAADLLAIVDFSALETKNISIWALMNSPGSIGSVNPDTGEFTSLELPTGATINEFSTDGTLADDSDTVVPTERAVKTYVDTAISNLNPNKIWQGDSYVEVLDTTTGNVNIVVDGVQVGEYNVSGLTLQTGSRINEFSIDGTLSGNSDTVVPTEQAVKTYVDTQISTFSTNTIWQDDSYVRVLDDGTTAGSISIVADGVEVGYYDALSTTQRIGKATNAGKIELSDTQVSINVGVDTTDSNIVMSIDSTNYLNITSNEQILGTSTARVSLVQNESAEISSGNTRVQLFEDDGVRITPEGSVSVFELREFEVKIQPNGVNQFTADTTGIVLATGVHVNNITNDVTLSNNSHTSLATEHAVKTYVDNNISHALPDRITDGLAVARVVDSTANNAFTVSLRGTSYGPDSTSTTDLFYFNDTTATNSNWSNPGNMVDGNINSYAQAGSIPGAYQQLNHGNSATIPVTDKYIEKVELRVYGRDGEGPNISAFNLYPVFGGSVQGNSQNLRSFLGPIRSWTPWIDITTDPFAPESWTWQDVVNLDTKLEAIIGSPGGGLGDVLEVNKIELQVTYTETPAIIESVERLRVDDDGLKVEKGSTVNEFSTDITLSDNSNSAIPTERAVKTYIDTQIQMVRNDLDLINIRYINTDSTSVTGDVCLVSTTAGTVNIQLIENPEGKVVIKKITSDNNPIYVSGTPGVTIDGQSTYTIDTPYKSITFLSDGQHFYII
jgi:hypothetical protein